MLSITLEDAERILEQNPVLVENEKICESQEVNTRLFWTGVCCKDPTTNRLTTPDQVNTHISRSLNDLAGVIKFSGWGYEKEVRLCAMERLFEGQKLAVRMPKSIGVVLGPGFDKEGFYKELLVLYEHNICPEKSFYDGAIIFKSL